MLLSEQQTGDIDRFNGIDSAIAVELSLLADLLYFK